MNVRTFLFATATLGFTALTVWAVLGSSDFGVILTWISANPWGSQIAVDLAVSLCFGVTWLLSDAKRLGINPIPYLALCMVLGSLGLLVYATRRSVVGDHGRHTRS